MHKDESVCVFVGVWGGRLAEASMEKSPVFAIIKGHNDDDGAGASFLLFAAAETNSCMRLGFC